MEPLFAVAFHVASPALPLSQSRGQPREAHETQAQTLTFDPRLFYVNSDEMGARRCVPGELSPLTGLMRTLWVMCGWCF